MDNNAAQEKGGKSYSIPTTKIVHIMRGSQVGALRQKREKYWKTKGWSEDMVEEEQKEWRGGPVFLPSTALPIGLGNRSLWYPLSFGVSGYRKGAPTASVAASSALQPIRCQLENKNKTNCYGCEYCGWEDEGARLA